MDSGVTRAIVLAAFAVAALSVVFFSGGNRAVFLNGERLGELEVVGSSSGPLVPLRKATQLFGGRADPGRSGGYVLEWGKTESFFVNKSSLAVKGGRDFINLDFLVEKLGGRVDYSPSRADVRIQPAKLLAASVGAGEISLEFSKYTNFSRSKPAANKLALKFFNTVKVDNFAGLDVSLDTRYLTDSSIISEENDQLVLNLTLRDGVRSTVKTTRGSSGFHFQLELARDDVTGPSPGPSTNLAADQKFSYNRMNIWADGGSQTLHYLEVSNWNQGYRLVPVLPGGEVGSGAKLSKLVQDNFGVAGLNANFFDPGSFTPIGLVVKNGKLLSRDWGERAALGIDYFGRLRFFRPDLDLFLRTSGGEVTVRGFNRPVSNDDLVVYTENYSNDPGRINSGTVLVLRDGKVIERRSSFPNSITSGKTIVVATGERQEEISGLVRGVNAEFDWTMEPFIPLLRGAVSAGPLLIKDGENVLDLERENFTVDGGLVKGRARRTVLANTNEGDLYFIVVTGGGVGLRALPE
ncbi:phosphodiester glycosidase family protein, partial [Candidatus Bipolaricaulota bacterium]|nr:phosphodiester glycosidase family protein [Candidatus Bipolaricaulota bacterium]